MSPALASLAAALFLAAGSQDAPSTDTTLQEARALVERGSLNEAEAMVRRQVESQPSAAGHFLLGYILFRQAQATGAVDASGGAHSEATREKARDSLREFAKGDAIGELSASDLKIAALDQLLLKDYISADKLLTRSVEADPKDSQAWYYLGRTKYNENRFQEAIDAFESCLRLEPNNVRAKDNQGLAYAGLGRNDEAEAAYATAIEWQAAAPNPDAGPFLNLGSLLLEQNQAGEAVPHLVKAVALAPRNPRSHERLGKAYLQIGDTDKAIAELEAAVALEPDTAPLRFVLGQAYRKKGWTDKAKAEFERVAVLNRKRNR